MEDDFEIAISNIKHSIYDYNKAFACKSSGTRSLLFTIMHDFNNAIAKMKASDDVLDGLRVAGNIQNIVYSQFGHGAEAIFIEWKDIYNKFATKAVGLTKHEKSSPSLRSLEDFETIEGLRAELAERRGEVVKNSASSDVSPDSKIELPTLDLRSVGSKSRFDIEKDYNLHRIKKEGKEGVNNEMASSTLASKAQTIKKIGKDKEETRKKKASAKVEKSVQIKSSNSKERNYRLGIGATLLPRKKD